jgi:hypothetical protein
MTEPRPDPLRGGDCRPTVLFDRSVSVEKKLSTALARRVSVDLPASDDAIGTHGCSPNEGSLREGRRVLWQPGGAHLRSDRG